MMLELLEVTFSGGALKLTSKAGYAKTMLARMIGLMFAPPSVEIDGLLIEPCNSIHTFFMRFNLDLVFLSSENIVLKLQRNVRPWRMTWIVWRAAKVLELKSGLVPHDLKVGDRLEFTCIK